MGGRKSKTVYQPPDCSWFDQQFAQYQNHHNAHANAAQACENQLPAHEQHLRNQEAQLRNEHEQSARENSDHAQQQANTNQETAQLEQQLNGQLNNLRTLLQNREAQWNEQFENQRESNSHDEEMSRAEVSSLGEHRDAKELKFLEVLNVQQSSAFEFTKQKKEEYDAILEKMTLESSGGRKKRGVKTKNFSGEELHRMVQETERDLESRQFVCSWQGSQRQYDFLNLEDVCNVFRQLA